MVNVGFVVFVMFDLICLCLYFFNFFLDGLVVDDLLKKLVLWMGEFFDCGFGLGEIYLWFRSIV